MAIALPPFQRFITRVHRRYVLMHVVEHGVIGLMLGAITGIVLTAILIWRGVATETVAVASPLLGLALGVLQGINARPSRMQAAVIADEQLRLSDLLGSALVVSESADWAHVIRSQADAACRRLSPSDVILHRLGVRVWGGAGLASALLCALVLVPTSATPSQARVSNEAVATSGNTELTYAGAQPHPTTLQADPDSAEHSDFGDNAVAPKKNDVATTDDPRDPASQGKQAAGGAGTASADASNATHLKLNAGAHPRAAGHAPAAGSGMESTGIASADSAGMSTAAGAPQQPAPPWKSTTWPSQVKQVQSDLRAGHIPDAYRDMVSGYFDAH